MTVPAERLTAFQAPPKACQAPIRLCPEKHLLITPIDRWKPREKFSRQWVLAVASKVSAALSYMHSKGICHGDVYAHNILANADGNAVLCDYGESD